VAGSSPHFGRARFLPWAFSAVQFNLDKKRPESPAPTWQAPAPAQWDGDEN
jgi:hypothetical protein